jgi:2,4-dienoyl-CoA reductase-like NADH-dependent reductase (Old Yellow Enzyme family)
LYYCGQWTRRYDPARAHVKDEIGLSIIANGGFQEHELIERTLSEQKADLVAMEHPLLAKVCARRCLANKFAGNSNEVGLAGIL